MNTGNRAITFSAARSVTVEAGIFTAYRWDIRKAAQAPPGTAFPLIPLIP